MQKLFATLIIAIWCLYGCASRPGSYVLETTYPKLGTKIVTVYVATTRGKGDKPTVDEFNSMRSTSLTFARFDISIPPNHKPNAIEWPNRRPNASKSFAVVGKHLLTRDEFSKEIARSQNLSAVTTSPKTAIFVHGYNYSFQESLFRLAQMASDSNLDGTPVLFAWPSEAALGGYVADKDAATFSRDGLADVLSIVGGRANRGRVIVFGHSMGAWLTVESIRQLRIAKRDDVISKLNVVLAAPDIDVDVFKSQLAVIGPLKPPLVILASKDDKALSLSSFLSFDRPRLGNVDIDDPIVRQAAVLANVQVVDISRSSGSDPINHDRYIGLSAVYPALSKTSLGKVGTFVFDNARLLSTNLDASQ